MDNLGKLAQHAELDQMIAGLQAFAKASRALYVALIESGFDEEIALRMVEGWQTATIYASQSKGAGQ